MTNVLRTTPDVVVDETVVSPSFYAPRESRVAWGAVFAGVIIALIAQIMMNILGAAVGAAAIDPEAAINPIGPTISTGAVIWIAVSSLISLFLGGFVAARLAGIPDNLEGVLHGLLTWAIATFITLFFLSSTVGSVFAGVSSVLTEGISLIGAGVADVAPEVADAVNLQSELSDAIRSEAGSLSTDTSDLSSDAVFLLQLNNLAQAEAGSPEADEARDVLATVLADQTELSESQIQARIDRWQTSIQQASQDAAEVAEEAAANLADALAIISGLLFLTLVIGAFAASMGGIAGRPDEIVDAEV